jgi:hypothetical protein
MNNQNEINKGQELIVYSKSLSNPTDSLISKIKQKWQECLDSCENHRQKLVNHYYYQKTINLIENYSYLTGLLISKIATKCCPECAKRKDPE